ncbi:hypothetical protein BKA69DRAFT_1102612 [Paraphysoderma sedebokerense]|nr:hypothetical protein BKA69DRAFT_1102612 [Paraphysoderma sedebokerense]
MILSNRVCSKCRNYISALAPTIGRRNFPRGYDYATLFISSERYRFRQFSTSLKSLTASTSNSISKTSSLSVESLNDNTSAIASPTVNPSDSISPTYHKSKKLLDYRVEDIEVDRERASISKWNGTFERCTTPSQIRVSVNKLFHSTECPDQSDIIAALNACSRLSVIFAKHDTSRPRRMKQFVLDPQRLPDTVASSQSSSTQTRQDFQSEIQRKYQTECFSIAQDVVQRLIERGGIPSVHIYSAFITVCAYTGEVESAFRALEDLKKNGVVPNVEIYKGLIMASAKSGNLEKALDVVHESVNATSAFSRHATWLRVALRLAVGIEAGKWAGLVFSVLTGTSETAGTIIGIGFGSVFGIRLAIALALPQLKGGFTLSGFVDQVNKNSTLMLSRKSKKSSQADLSDSEKVDQYLHEYLISVLEKTGDIKGALQVMEDARKKGVEITVETYNTIIDHLLRANKVSLALLTLKRMSLTPTADTFQSFLTYYHYRNDHAAAISLFEKYIKPLNLYDSTIYASMISAYGKIGKVTEAGQLFLEILKSGKPPDSFVMNNVINIMGKNGMYATAENVVLELLPKYHCAPTVRTYGKLIHLALSIPESYSPPSSSTLERQIPTSLLQSFPPPTESTKVTENADEGVPMSIQRAWFWFHEAKRSNLINETIFTSMMNVCNKSQRYRLTAYIYRDNVETCITQFSEVFPNLVPSKPSQTVFQNSTTPLFRLPTIPLLPNYILENIHSLRSPSARDAIALPGTSAYFSFIRAAVWLPEYSIAELMKIIPELSIRGFWSTTVPIQNIVALCKRPLATSALDPMKFQISLPSNYQPPPTEPRQRRFAIFHQHIIIEMFLKKSLSELETIRNGLYELSRKTDIGLKDNTIILGLTRKTKPEIRQELYYAEILMALLDDLWSFLRRDKNRGKAVKRGINDEKIVGMHVNSSVRTAVDKSNDQQDEKAGKWDDDEDDEFIVAVDSLKSSSPLLQPTLDSRDPGPSPVNQTATDNFEASFTQQNTGLVKSSRYTFYRTSNKLKLVMKDIDDMLDGKILKSLSTASIVKVKPRKESSQTAPAASASNVSTTPSDPKSEALSATEPLLTTSEEISESVAHSSGGSEATTINPLPSSIIAPTSQPISRKRGEASLGSKSIKKNKKKNPK